MTPVPLPDSNRLDGVSLLKLNERGLFLDSGKEVEPDHTKGFLRRKLYIDPETTDVFVWVHGWRNTVETAMETAARLFTGIEHVQGTHKEEYPALRVFRPAYIAVHWPSQSLPSFGGYKKIRDRAHAMTTEGTAEFVLASLLGYLEEEQPGKGRSGTPGTLRARDGYYVHCIGHSFGGRFLCEAISAAASPSLPTLSLLPKNELFDFTVDTLLVFQMAAEPDVFAHRFKPLLDKAPLQGPICLTHSKADRALCTWHRHGEGVAGIGCQGAAEPSDSIGATRLRPANEPYTRAELSHRIVNIDAGWAYRKSPLLAPQGAHSDFFYEESIHLLLTLADFAR